MKLYFKKLFLLLLLTAMLLCMAAVFDFTVVGNQYSHFYTASLMDKVDRLCSITEPKIILVGNSNVSFGMDSALLEDARASFTAALLLLYGQPPEENHREMAAFLAKNLTKTQIMRTIELLQKYHGECVYNVSPSHVLGALAVELEGIL